ncbi:2'-5' RNA ligase [Natronospira proteinivora]|uniref:RNA 2',3'-cyclic phosphodiesterase n=1 Tax=Natronospira proteinivora TaxID=1807133 RepID=A0ABT1G834_9GAMM|nr:RNA 2',3'-cyclic phosphodiesterase [Natronospira proteinivora]MCP1727469.1 2'-5' RNA ligase [Natronospira proteinivora]
MTKERLFFALWPSDNIREALRPAADAVRDAAADGKTVSQDKLHITLRFMGSLDADQWKAAELAASRVRERSIDLLLDRAGYWPQSRVLWIGCGEVPDALLGLVADLNTELGGEGFELTGRPYRPHVTVARGVTDCAELPPIRPIHWEPAHFVLVRSQLGAGDPSYEIVGEWPIR